MTNMNRNFRLATVFTDSVFSSRAHKRRWRCKWSQSQRLLRLLTTCYPSAVFRWNIYTERGARHLINLTHVSTIRWLTQSWMGKICWNSFSVIGWYINVIFRLSSLGTAIWNFFVSTLVIFPLSSYLRQIHFKVQHAFYFHFSVKTISSEMNRSVDVIVVIRLNYFIVKVFYQILSVNR